MTKNTCIAVFILFLIAGACPVYAQNKLLKDSTYISIQKIKNDSARNIQTLNYMSASIMRKNALGPELIDAAVKYASDEKNDKLLAKTYGVIGEDYLRTGEYAVAYPYLLKALTVYQRTDDPKLLIRVYQNMSWIQIQLKDDAAEATLEKALKIAREKDYKGIESELYSLLGVYYDSHSKFDQAIAAYKNSIAIGEKYAAKYSLTSAYINLGIAYRRSNRNNEALESLLKARELAVQIKDKYLDQSINQNLAELTLAMKDYDKAEKYILIALSDSKDNNEPVLRRGLYENMESIYRKKGDFKKALDYSDSVAVMDKKVFDKEKIASVRDLQTKYETALKDQQIQKQNAKNLQQQQLLELNQKKAQIQQINFTDKQAQLENDKKLEASLLQKNTIQAQLDKQVRDAQIAKQGSQIKSTNRQLLALLGIGLFAIVIATVVYINQQKTKRLNKVITVQKQELEEVNAVKDRMFSIIGHDMRSPINTLIAFNHLLENENVSGEKLKLYSGEIKKTLDNTANMMNNLLNWANSQMQGYAPDFDRHNLKNIAAQVLNALTPQAEQKGVVIQDRLPDNIVVYADSNMTELILRNLVTNAIKFTPKTGTITVDAAQFASETTFWVSDSGVGMPPELVNHFNEKKSDYTVKSTPGTNKEKGTGLGLVLCKTFIELMNGDIKVKSDPGVGTTFTVTIGNAIS